jgi:hypothetical protein
MDRGGNPMPSWWLRLALIVVLVLVFWWLVATFARGVAERAPGGTGMVIPIEQRLVSRVLSEFDCA